MTQEDKQLLIKDLSARAPYKPKVKVLHVWNEDKEIEEDIVDTVYCVLPDGYINTETIDSDTPLNDIILYLRPMSSMTEEEEDLLYSKVLLEPAHRDEDDACFNDDEIVSYVDYCYSRHLDIHGLIDKGLALEAPKEMYKI